jgi:hypothetical protein
VLAPFTAIVPYSFRIRDGLNVERSTLAPGVGRQMLGVVGLEHLDRGGGEVAWRS